MTLLFYFGLSFWLTALCMAVFGRIHKIRDTQRWVYCFIRTGMFWMVTGALRMVVQNHNLTVEDTLYIRIVLGITWVGMLAATSWLWLTDPLENEDRGQAPPRI